MPIRNTATEYGSVTKFLHWLIVFLILFMLVLGFVMGDLSKAVKAQAYMIHKSVGISILVIMVLRLIWAIFNPKPKLENTATWEKNAERTVHVLFYIVLFALPLTGWVMTTAADKLPSFFGMGHIIPFPGIAKSKSVAEFFDGLHVTLPWILMSLMVIHIAAALKHHYILKDSVLKRMMPTKKDPSKDKEV